VLPCSILNYKNTVRKFAVRSSFVCGSKTFLNNGEGQYDARKLHPNRLFNKRLAAVIAVCKAGCINVHSINTERVSCVFVREALNNLSMNSRSTKWMKCDFRPFRHFQWLAAIENDGTFMYRGNSGKIRVS
jgi:hypothetical protein